MKQGRYFVFRWEQLLPTWCHPWWTPLASRNILRRRCWLIFALKNEDWAAPLSLSLFKSGTSRSSLLSWTLCIPLFVGEREKWENPRKCVTELSLFFGTSSFKTMMMVGKKYDYDRKIKKMITWWRLWSYHIFVISFTWAKFLENKIYTEKTRKLRQNTQ